MVTKPDVAARAAQCVAAPGVPGARRRIRDGSSRSGCRRRADGLSDARQPVGVLRRTVARQRSAVRVEADRPRHHARCRAPTDPRRSHCRLPVIGARAGPQRVTRPRRPRQRHRLGHDSGSRSGHCRRCSHQPTVGSLIADRRSSASLQYLARRRMGTLRTVDVGWDAARPGATSVNECRERPAHRRAPLGERPLGTTP